MTNSSLINPTISLAEIRKHNPCFDGWRAGVKAFGKNGLEERISLGDIASNQGASDALWCLRVFDFSGEFKVLVLNKVIHPALDRARITVDATATADATAYTAYATADATVTAAAYYAADATYYAAATTYYAATDAATDAATEAHYKERELQKKDIIANFPPVFLI